MLILLIDLPPDELGGKPDSNEDNVYKMLMKTSISSVGLSLSCMVN